MPNYMLLLSELNVCIITVRRDFLLAPHVLSDIARIRFKRFLRVFYMLILV